MAVMKGSQENFDTEILGHDGIVFVDFYADWCGPCKMTSPLIEELSEDEKFKDIKFVKINVDENQELAGKFNIFSIPTFMTFSKGEVIGQFAGARDRGSFENELEKAMQSSVGPSKEAN
jgi:thioredoxin 1